MSFSEETKEALQFNIKSSRNETNSVLFIAGSNHTFMLSLENFELTSEEKEDGDFRLQYAITINYQDRVPESNVANIDFNITTES